MFLTTPTMGTRLLPNRRRRAGGGSGGGGSSPSAPSVSVDTDALLYFDSFNRADSATVGTPDQPSGAGAWVEEQGTAAISSNALAIGADATATFVHRPNTEVASEIFGQSVGQQSDILNTPIVLGYFDTDAFATRSGYQQRTSNTNMFVDRQDTFANIASVGFAAASNLDYVYELYAADGVQQAAIWRDGVPASLTTVDAADTTHDGVDKRVSLQIAGDATDTGQWSQSWHASSRTVAVHGLQSGQGAWIITSNGTVISHLTASGSAVSMDISRRHQQLDTDDIYPVSGLSLHIREAAGSELTVFFGDDHPSGNIWPGVYTVSQ